MMMYIIFQEPHNSVLYSLVGDSTALEYFTVNAKTGDLYQRKAFLFDQHANDRYTVRH